VTEPPRSLLTDLYELTMSASYFADGMNYESTFELFWRELPPRRNFLIASGLQQALEFLDGFGFRPDEIEYLSGLELFDHDFLEFLRDLRFTGDVWAIPEGEAVFPNEPALRVTAPLIEAQLVETYLLNCLDFQTLIASKAARMGIACQGRPFVDFSARRDHGADAANLAARASFIAGASATSNMLAAKEFGIPPSGTMAHSYVMTSPSEAEAFRRFARQFPDRAVLLIDTFDTLRGAKIAAEVATELAAEGIEIRGVRIDSGDLASSSKEVRSILDAAGHNRIEIFASGDLDEYRIESLLADGAPIDGFGVGTSLGTGGDVAHLGGAYKLVEDASGPKSKLSQGKETLPGVKQVYRFTESGNYVRDVLALQAEEAVGAGGRGMLECVMKSGEVVGPAPSLEDLRQRCWSTMNSLAEGLRSLETMTRYPVELSPGLSELAQARRTS
jgi:nicotinate phosphoribosyltransferase